MASSMRESRTRFGLICPSTMQMRARWKSVTDTAGPGKAGDDETLMNDAILRQEAARAAAYRQAGAEAPMRLTISPAAADKPAYPAPVRWQSGDAADCKSAYAGSIPARTSKTARQAVLLQKQLNPSNRLPNRRGLAPMRGDRG